MITDVAINFIVVLAFLQMLSHEIINIIRIEEVQIKYI
jgi:hypothetical protein